MIAFITGGSRGMGRAIAEELAERGWDLLLTAQNSLPLEQTAAEIHSQFGGTVDAHAVDLAGGEAAAAELYSWAADKTNSLDALVLDAGYFQEGELATFEAADFRRNLEVNFLANHFLVQRMLVLLSAAPVGRVIIIGSTAAYEPYPLVPSYGVAKWALRGLAVNLRSELAGKGIAVTLLSPGATWTDMWLGEDLPADRLLLPTDVAKMVAAVLLLSPQAVVEEIVMRPMLGDIHE